MKKTIPNIYLIGSFGTGKSTIGRELAKLLKRDFYDTDHLLEKKLGVDISWAVDIEGKEKLLQREYELLKTLVTLPNIVLSTGGMTILSEESRKLLRDNGIVIALATDLPQQLERTRYDNTRRPLIRGINQKETQKRLQAFRKNFEDVYQKIALKTFSTSRKSARQVAKEIRQFLQEYAQNPAL